MAANYGAHEIMEVHEVLTDTIDGINQFLLYRPYVQDPQLASMVDNQINFMNQEYNTMINLLNHQGIDPGAQYRSPGNFTPTYGLNNPPSQHPNATINQMNDKDVASGMLGCHKSSAGLRMLASLECADPNIRNTIKQGAINCADQAYEVWQFMNSRGYYQVPTMKQMTTDTVLGTYTMSNLTAPNQMAPNVSMNMQPLMNPQFGMQM